MATPKAKFIGRSSADPTPTAWRARAKDLLNYRWIQKKPWQEEIKRVLAFGLKYELDALAKKDFRYLTKTCLPSRLTEEDCLD